MSKSFDKNVIMSLLAKLSEERQVFCSEADFQLEFSRYIRNYLEDKYSKNDFKILLEYYYKFEDNEPMYIDILVIL